jgi:hypothetical protein
LGLITGSTRAIRILVLSRGARQPMPFRNGALRDGRRYQLVREHDAVRERTVEITFLGPGAEACAFTFG